MEILNLGYKDLQAFPYKKFIANHIVPMKMLLYKREQEKSLKQSKCDYR